jgi:uncharacterized protein RhaS with RHS repeats
LSYFGARNYDPLRGQFISIDPVGFSPNNIHSFNRYAYGNNNPYRYIDPDGRSAEDQKPDIKYHHLYPKPYVHEVTPPLGAVAGFSRLLGATTGVAGAAKGVAGVPGRVQSRINLANEGMEHLAARHLSGKANASQFSIAESEVRGLLQSSGAVNTPVSRTIDSADGVRYIREFDAGRAIGFDKFNGGKATSTMTIMTDKSGNLVTSFPGVLK